MKISFSEYIAQNVRTGHADLTPGYYWTPADYASGATKDYTNETETRYVAWYSGDPDMPAISFKLMPVAQKVANQLGLCDMSGNVTEWCFTASGDGRVLRGGNCASGADTMLLGIWMYYSPDITDMGEGAALIGFRFVRTQ